MDNRAVELSDPGCALCPQDLPVLCETQSRGEEDGPAGRGGEGRGVRAGPLQRGWGGGGRGGGGGVPGGLHEGMSTCVREPEAVTSESKHEHLRACAVRLWGCGKACPSGWGAQPWAACRCWRCLRVFLP